MIPSNMRELPFRYILDTERELIKGPLSITFGERGSRAGTVIAFSIIPGGL